MEFVELLANSWTSPPKLSFWVEILRPTDLRHYGFGCYQPFAVSLLLNSIDTGELFTQGQYLSHQHNVLSPQLWYWLLHLNLCHGGFCIQGNPIHGLLVVQTSKPSDNIFKNNNHLKTKPHSSPLKSEIMGGVFCGEVINYRYINL